MNFLDLCRQLELESGTVDPGKLIGSVTGTASRRTKIVGWVQAAWTIVQGARGDWRFMRRDYAGTLTIGTARYAGADLGIARFAGWLRDRPGYRPHAIHDPAKGPADLTELSEIGWEEWRAAFGRGAAPVGRPAVYAIAPDERICLGPVPDRAYAIDGEYRRGLQTLAANEDVPEMPAEHHLAILWRALMLLGEHDEAPATVNAATIRFIAAMEKLERDQTDRPVLGRARAIA
jgi:hypothetical protein